MQRQHQEKYRALGLNIAYYRKMKKMTQMDLAEKAQISRTHMSRIETAECAVSLDVVYTIAEVLEISPAKLFETR